MSETLQAVNSFRRMWANTDEAESGRLIREAGRAAESPSDVVSSVLPDKPSHH
jgi:hypothetical protein